MSEENGEFIVQFNIPAHAMRFPCDSCQKPFEPDSLCTISSMRLCHDCAKKHGVEKEWLEIFGKRIERNLSES